MKKCHVYMKGHCETFYDHTIISTTHYYIITGRNMPLPSGLKIKGRYPVHRASVMEYLEDGDEKINESNNSGSINFNNNDCCVRVDDSESSLTRKIREKIELDARDYHKGKNDIIDEALAYDIASGHPGHSFRES